MTSTPAFTLRVFSYDKKEECSKAKSIPPMDDAKHGKGSGALPPRRAPAKRRPSSTAARRAQKGQRREGTHLTPQGTGTRGGGRREGEKGGAKDLLHDTAGIGNVSCSGHTLSVEAGEQRLMGWVPRDGAQALEWGEV